MRPEPTPPVGNDGEHDDQLDRERDPDRPVENRRDPRHGSPTSDCSTATTGITSSAATSIGNSNRLAILWVRRRHCCLVRRDQSSAYGRDECASARQVRARVPRMARSMPARRAEARAGTTPSRSYGCASSSRSESSVVSAVSRWRRGNWKGQGAAVSPVPPARMLPQRRLGAQPKSDGVERNEAARALHPLHGPRESPESRVRREDNPPIARKQYARLAKLP